MKRLAFLPFGDGEDLVDVAAGADGDYFVAIVSGFPADVFFHGVPGADGDLVLEKADGTDIKGGGEEQAVAGEEGQFCAAAADVDIKIGVFFVQVFGDVVLIDERGLAAAADDLDFDAGLFPDPADDGRCVHDGN